jgi:hypothetical protein
MSDRHLPLTRRDFVRTGSGAAIGASVAAAAWGQATPRAPRSATVTLVRDERVLDAEHRVNAQVLAAMLGETVVRVTGKATPREGWASLFTPGDVVGLVPTQALNPTHDELVAAVRAALTDAGVPADNIRAAQGSAARATPCTALLCMPALKAHWLTGIGTVLKNYIMFAEEPSRYHDASNDLLGEIWLLPHVKDKTRLVLVDALRPLCDKGPQVDPRYLWDYKGLLAGTDPVAVEAVGLKIITARRDAVKGEPWPLSPPPTCVTWADQRYNLGTAKLEEITIKRSGFTQDALV